MLENIQKYPYALKIPMIDKTPKPHHQKNAAILSSPVKGSSTSPSSKILLRKMNKPENP